MSTLRGRKYQDIEDIQKEKVTTALKGVPKMFPTVAAPLG
jgi:hypothetical protein